MCWALVPTISHQPLSAAAFIATAPYLVQTANRQGMSFSADICLQAPGCTWEGLVDCRFFLFLFRSESLDSFAFCHHHVYKKRAEVFACFCLVSSLQRHDSFSFLPAGAKGGIDNCKRWEGRKGSRDRWLGFNSRLCWLRNWMEMICTIMYITVAFSWLFPVLWLDCTWCFWVLNVLEIFVPVRMSLVASIHIPPS